MIVVCKSNEGKDLSKKTLESGIGYIPRTCFPIKIGNAYTVYGVALYQGVVHYLIIPEQSDFPSWYPAEMFDVVDSLLSTESYIQYFENEETSGFSFLCGYHELVFDNQHRADLLERREQAIKIFLKRKKEIDQAQF